MKRQLALVLLLLGLMLAATACNNEPEVEPPDEAPVAEEAAVEENAADKEVAEEEVAEEVAAEEEAEEDTAVAAATATPQPDLPTPTAAPEGEVAAAEVSAAEVLADDVMAQAQSNLNLRTGPGTDYAVVDGMSAGEEFTLIGRIDDGSWLIGRTDDGEQVWLTADPALVSVDSSQVETLPIVKAPPQPYNANNIQVDEILNKIPLVIHNSDNFTCASEGGINKLARVLEGNIIGPHSGDFVMLETNKNVLFRYTGGTVQLINETATDAFPNGETSLSLAQALKMFEDSEIDWTGAFGEWPARGVTGCDPSAAP
jgi:uncharacterized protein YgiM (DUF1202 family)